MKANTPSECPRGPHRRAYTPAPTTARNARSRARGTSCSRAASASAGRPTTGSNRVVTACPRTVGSATVNRASNAARPPVIAATSECPTAPHNATASPTPTTARVANRSRIRPGSGATNALFSKLPRPFRTQVPRHEKGAAETRSAIDASISAPGRPTAQQRPKILSQWSSHGGYGTATGGPMDHSPAPTRLRPRTPPPRHCRVHRLPPRTWPALSDHSHVRARGCPPWMNSDPSPGHLPR